MARACGEWNGPTCSPGLPRKVLFARFRSSVQKKTGTICCWRHQVSFWNKKKLVKIRKYILGGATLPTIEIRNREKPFKYLKSPTYDWKSLFLWRKNYQNANLDRLVNPTDLLLSDSIEICEADCWKTSPSSGGRGWPAVRVTSSAARTCGRASLPESESSRRGSFFSPHFRAASISSSSNELKSGTCTKWARFCDTWSAMNQWNEFDPETRDQRWANEISSIPRHVVSDEPMKSVRSRDTWSGPMEWLHISGCIHGGLYASP